MSFSLMEIFTRNQISIDAMYEGEIITFKGKKYDTSKIVKGLDDTKDYVDNNGELELVVSYLMNNDIVAFNDNNSEKVTLLELFSPFRDKLPTKYKAEDFISRTSGRVYEATKLNVLNPDKSNIDIGVYSSMLVVREYTEEVVAEAMKCICGLDTSRYVYTRTKGTLNGNMLDITVKDFKRFDTKGKFTSRANMFRSMGIPYSDYRKFITYGYLVSYGMKSEVFVMDNKYIYCMNIIEFTEFIERMEDVDETYRKYKEVFVIDDLGPFRKYRWELMV